MLPPSDSEDDTDSDEEKGDAPRGQNPRAGMLPPTDSTSDESSDDSDGGDDNDAKKNKAATLRPAVPDAPRRRKQEEELDPEMVRAEMERLEIVKKRREEQRLKRIADEGWYVCL